MEQSSGRILFTFLAGSAAGAGAALLASRMCRMRKQAVLRKTEKGAPERPDETYCIGTEVAEICIPEQ
jgi:hypothetical protein